MVNVEPMTMGAAVSGIAHTAIATNATMRNSPQCGTPITRL